MGGETAGAWERAVVMQMVLPAAPPASGYAACSTRPTGLRERCGGHPGVSAESWRAASLVGSAAALCGSAAAASLASRGRSGCGGGAKARATRLPRPLRAESATAAGGVTTAAELVQWVRDRGGSVSDALSVVEDDPCALKDVRERGTVAARSVPEGEAVLELPPALCFVAMPELEASLQPAAEELAAARMDIRDAALTVAYAEERALGEGSAWWPYITAVGEPEETFPAFWDEGDLDALQSPPLAESLRATGAALRRLSELRGLDIRAVTSAWQLVSSRRFGYDEGHMMLPIGDLLNHSFDPTCAWEPPSATSPAWRCVATRALEAGEPINWCYAKDPNHLMLSTQGFIMPENPFNRVMAKPADLRRCLEAVFAPALSEFSQWRSEELAKQLPDPVPNVPGAALFVVGCAENGVQWNPLWLNMVGMAVSTDGQTHWSQVPGGKQRFYAALEKATLMLFDTTYDEDVAALEAGGLSANRKLAKMFLLGQKELALFALGSLQQQLVGDAGQQP